MKVAFPFHINACPVALVSRMVIVQRFHAKLDRNKNSIHTTLEKILKRAFSLWKRIKCFPSTLRRRNLKTQQSLVVLDLCLGKTRAGKSRDYSDVKCTGTFGLWGEVTFFPEKILQCPNAWVLKSVGKRTQIVWKTKSLTIDYFSVLEWN